MHLNKLKVRYSLIVTCKNSSDLLKWGEVETKAVICGVLHTHNHSSSLLKVQAVKRETIQQQFKKNSTQQNKNMFNVGNYN